MTAVEHVASTSSLSGVQVTYAQTAPAGAVTRRPILGGARPSMPGEVIVPLRIMLRDRDRRRPPLTFDQLKAPKFQDVFSEAGSGSVVFANDDPDLAQISETSLLMFELHGYAAFTMLPRQLDRVTVSPQEEVGEQTTVSGPGNLAVLEEALVYPSRGLGAWPIEDDRSFTWHSTDYDDSPWGPSYGIVKVSTPDTYWSKANIEDWPDPDAEWMWAPGYVKSDTPGAWAPPGPCYFRQEIWLPDGSTELEIYAAFDDVGDVYLDGQSVLHGEFGNNPTITGNVNDRMKVFSERMPANAGRHLIAIRNDNGMDIEGDESDNPGGVLFTCYAKAGSIRMDTPLLRSDSTWRCLPYPPQPPGMTPGEAMLHCINEGQARGALNGLECAFDRYTDSAGVPWPVVGDIATKVGYDLLTFFRELAGTYIDIAMAPGSLVLYAWAYGQRGERTGIQLVKATGTPDSGSIAQLNHKRVM
jgi:hypothetical protein